MLTKFKLFIRFNGYWKNKNVRTYSQSKNPFSRTWNVLSSNIPFLGLNKKPSIYPEHADIVIIGGGLIGSSVAYWLKTKAGEGLSVVVLEKDPMYVNNWKCGTLGTLIQHYSLPENINLSLYGADFLRNVKQHLGSEINIEYNPHGHLVLACEKYAHKLEENVTIQREFGVRNELLTVEDLNQRFPWINTHDVSLGSMGIESEGTFNAWTLLQSLIFKSQEMGAMYVKAEVIGFELEQQRDVLMEGVAPGTFKRINRVIYKTSDQEEHAIKFAGCILAGGHSSGEISKLAKIGTGDGLLSIPLPIEARKHKVYAIENGGKTTGLCTPLITDTSGLWLRRNGLDSNILCGHVPFKSATVKDNLHEDYLKEIVLPSLHNRFPKWEDNKVHDVGIETYDFNKFDESGIVGPHPYHNNLYLATGFGQNACAHAPGIGRAIAELIIDSNFTTIDLTRFGFDRMLMNQPMIEFNIY